MLGYDRNNADEVKRVGSWKRRIPTWPILVKIADALGTSLDYLLRGREATLPLPNEFCETFREALIREMTSRRRYHRAWLKRSLPGAKEAWDLTVSAWLDGYQLRSDLRQRKNAFALRQQMARTVGAWP